MRQLIYVPIIHTKVDMGAMSDSVKKEYSARYGSGKWQQHVKTIEDMWKGLREKIFNLNLPYKKVRIYQDGLPVCGKELEIVREIAGKGSPNHKIIVGLVREGAKLEGTEDPDLLLQEYSNLKKHYKAAHKRSKIRAKQDSERSSEDLLMKRDKFIANRIETTLAEGDIGILFIGLRHSVNKYVRGIKISYLIHRLPFTESYQVTMAKMTRIS